MEYIKKVLKSLAYVAIPIIAIIFILTILNYFGIMPYKILNIFKYILVFISTFIGSIYYGLQNKKKGIQEGIKFGLIIIIILLLFNYLVFLNKFNIKALIYYILILIVSILGSVIGVNIKAVKK